MSSRVASVHFKIHCLIFYKRKSVKLPLKIATDLFAYISYNWWHSCGKEIIPNAQLKGSNLQPVVKAKHPSMRENQKEVTSDGLCIFPSVLICLFVFVFSNERRVNLMIQFFPVTQSCLMLCNPVDCGMSGLPVHHQGLPDSSVGKAYLKMGLRSFLFVCFSLDSLTFSWHFIITQAVFQTTIDHH